MMSTMCVFGYRRRSRTEVTGSVLDRQTERRRTLRPPSGTGLISDIDALIAKSALEIGLTDFTTDRDFKRVPGLDAMLLPRR